MSEHFQFTAVQANLRQGLALAKHFVSKESMLPVLHSVVLTGQAGDDFITLTATNLESILRVRVAAKVMNSGAMCASHSVLHDLVSTLPSDEPIEFKVQDDFRVEITSGGRAQETNLVLFDPNEFPLTPEVPTGESATSITLNGKIVLRLGEEIAPLAANDMTRPTLTGVSVRINDGTLVAAATDGFRLARATMGVSGGQDVAVIVPTGNFTPLIKLVKMVAKAQELDPEYVPVRMVIDTAYQRIFWAVESGYIATTLLNGTYPDYEAIIPKSHKTKAAVAAKTVYERAKTVSVIAVAADNAPINLEASDNTFKLTASVDHTGDADGGLDALVEGEPMKMAVAAPYLAKSLYIFSKADDDVVFHMNSPNEPLLLAWLMDDSLLHLIMPLHIGK